MSTPPPSLCTVRSRWTRWLVPVVLRPREFALLVHLAREPTRVHERQEILRAVWAYQRPGTTRTVDSHASRLRRKLAAAGANGWVCAALGIGYRLAPVAHGALVTPTFNAEGSLPR